MHPALAGVLAAAPTYGCIAALAAVNNSAMRAMGKSCVGYVDGVLVKCVVCMVVFVALRNVSGDINVLAFLR